MNQRTHSWIAIRAIGLLDDEGEVPDLVKLLEPHACMASVGAWVPDDTDAKRGDAGSVTENHILKMEPYGGPGPDRFVTRKNVLLNEIGPHRRAAVFLQNDQTLPDAWWAAPYRGDVDKPGKHLPNRAMALSTMLKDLILMGDPDVQELLPGAAPGFLKWMATETRTQDEATAMYFFMLSHFVADASMPCHCDARALAGYSNGLHKELEAHWSKQIGTAFDKVDCAFFSSACVVLVFRLASCFRSSCRQCAICSNSLQIAVFARRRPVRPVRFRSRESSCRRRRPALTDAR